LEQYIGQTIRTIDGESALQHIIDFCLTYGFLSKDLGTLFNYAIEKHFMHRNLVIDPFPSRSSVNYQFDNGAVNVPWLIASAKSISLTPNCLLGHELNDLPFDIISELEKAALLFHETPSISPQISLIPLYTSQSISVGFLSQEVLVMRIINFEPPNNDEFLNIVFNTIEVANLFDIPYLILDLRGNGGGDICLGYQVIDALMEESNPFGKYDIIHSPLMGQFANYLAQPQYSGFLFSPSFWDDPATNVPFTNISWYTPGNTFTRGGVASNYTKFVHLQCDNSTAPVRYLFDQILILTDGLCGSTCAVFSSHLAEADHIDTVVVGGLANTTMQYFSFPGGQVFSLRGMLGFAEEVNFQDPSLPKPFVTNAGVSFTLQEIYPWRKDNLVGTIPLEFHYRPATHHLAKWNFCI